MDDIIIAENLNLSYLNNIKGTARVLKFQPFGAMTVIQQV